MDIAQTTLVGVVAIYVESRLNTIGVKGSGQPNMGGTFGANHQVGLGQPIENKATTYVEPKHISMVQMLFLNTKLYRHGIGGTT